MINAIVKAEGRIETVTVTHRYTGRHVLETSKGEPPMTAWLPWKIAQKELKVIRRKKSIIYYTVGLPLLIAIVFSLVLKSQTANGIPNTIALGADSIVYLFVILATVLPSTIAAYSIVGEKVEKTLEPLLATPTTDGEILLGKSIAIVHTAYSIHMDRGINLHGSNGLFLVQWRG